MSATLKPSVKGTQVVTGEVRLSYVHLLEPAEDLNGTLKYSATVLIPKEDEETVEAIKTSTKAAINAGLNKKWGGVAPKKAANSMKDADVDENTSGEIYAEKSPETAGHYIIPAKSNKSIQVVDASLRTLEAGDEDKVYSGVYARVAMTPYLYSAQGKKGIAYALNSVQIIRDGEPLGGAAPTKASSVFDAVVSGDISSPEVDSDVDAMLGL